jgi:N-acetyl-gamma-glutamyl-phosphate reductase
MRIGVIGVNGYTGQTLLQALSLRDDTELCLVTSRGDAGKTLSRIHPSLVGVPAFQDLILEHPDSLEKLAKQDPGRFPELFFLCVPHGASMALTPKILALGARVIDLTGDFRLKDAAMYPKWYKIEHTAPDLLKDAVYGLPELHRGEIREARLLANPGCYPTSIILALAPLAHNSLLDPNDPVIADSKSGVSGAGRRTGVDYSFCELNDNFKAYKIVGHQHTPEARAELERLSKGSVKLSFTPHLLPLSRGILTTVYVPLKTGLTLPLALSKYADFYKNEPFVRFRGQNAPISVLDTRGTNFCDITLAIDEEAGLLKIISVIDNLARGAVTQAMVNFNIMTGRPETRFIPMVAFRP